MFLEMINYFDGISPTELAFNAFGDLMTVTEAENIYVVGVTDAYQTFVQQYSFEHTHTVGQTVFSPDGKIIASVQQVSPTLTIWDAYQGTSIYAVEDTWGKVFFSPDGNWLTIALHKYVNGEYRNGVLIWDTQTRSQTIIPTADTVEVTAISPDSKGILLNTGQLIDVQSKQISSFAPAHEYALFNNNGDKLIITNDQGISVIDIANGSVMYTLDEASSKVPPVLNPNKNQFAYVTHDTLRLVDMDSGVETSVDPVNNEDIWQTHQIQFNPDGTIIALAANNVNLWDSSSGKLLNRLMDHVFPPRAFAFSPDGKVLVSGGSEIIVWGTTEEGIVSSETPTPKTSTSGETIPSVTTTGKRWLAFHTGDFKSGDNHVEIAIMTEDGQNFKYLTQNDTCSSYSPDWSPDGKRIVYASDCDGNSEIYVMNWDGSNKTRLTFNREDDIQPFWINNSQIRFTSYKGDERLSFVMDYDGKNVQQYEAQPGSIVLMRDGSQYYVAENFSGALSPPDSPQRVAYTDGYEKGREATEIYVVDLNSGEQKRLTNNSVADFWPRWSGDGRNIFFLTTRDGFQQLYVMNDDGSSPRNISNTFEDVKSYYLSSDKMKIAFTNGDFRIYVVNADGSALTDLGIDGAGLDWSP